MEQYAGIKKDEPGGLVSNAKGELNVSIIQMQSPRYKIWLKSTAIIVTGVFLFQQIAWAGDIRDIIPQEEPAMQTLQEAEETLKRQQELLDQMEIVPNAEEEALPEE